MEAKEARSLTVINDLAANPPQYPERPSDERQGALTLYISRVPGTRGRIFFLVRGNSADVQM